MPVGGAIRERRGSGESRGVLARRAASVRRRSARARARSHCGECAGARRLSPIGGSALARQDLERCWHSGCGCAAAAPTAVVAASPAAAMYMGAAAYGAA